MKTSENCQHSPPTLFARLMQAETKSREQQKSFVFIHFPSLTDQPVWSNGAPEIHFNKQLGLFIQKQQQESWLEFENLEFALLIDRVKFSADTSQFSFEDDGEEPILNDKPTAHDLLNLLRGSPCKITKVFLYESDPRAGIKFQYEFLDLSDIPADKETKLVIKKSAITPPVLVFSKNPLLLGQLKSTYSFKGIKIYGKGELNERDIQELQQLTNKNKSINIHWCLDIDESTLLYEATILKSKIQKEEKSTLTNSHVSTLLTRAFNIKEYPQQTYQVLTDRLKPATALKVRVSKHHKARVSEILSFTFLLPPDQRAKREALKTKNNKERLSGISEMRALVTQPTTVAYSAENVIAQFQRSGITIKINKYSYTEHIITKKLKLELAIQEAIHSKRTGIVCLVDDYDTHIHHFKYYGIVQENLKKLRNVGKVSEQAKHSIFSTVKTLVEQTYPQEFSTYEFTEEEYLMLANLPDITDTVHFRAIKVYTMNHLQSTAEKEFRDFVNLGKQSEHQVNLTTVASLAPTT